MDILYFLIFPLITGIKIAEDSVEQIDDLIDKNERNLISLNKNISEFEKKLQPFVDLDSLPTNFSEHKDVINKFNLTNIFPTTKKIELMTKKLEPTTVKITAKRIVPTTVKITTKKSEPITEKLELTTKKGENSTKSFLNNIIDNVGEKIHNLLGSATTEKITTTTRKIEITTKKFKTDEQNKDSKLKIALWRIFIILFGLFAVPMCIAIVIFVVMRIYEFVSERSYIVNTYTCRERRQSVE